MPYLSIKDYLSIEIENKINLEHEEIQFAITRAEEISQYYPAEVRISVSHEGTKTFYEHADVFLIHPLDIRVGITHKNKYNFYPLKLHTLRNLTMSDKSRIEKEIGQPNQIGVLSQAKVNTWVNFWEQVYTISEEQDNKHYHEKEKFTCSLIGLPVKWSNDMKSGSIQKGGLEFSFVINETYVSTKIEVQYKTPSDLTTFLKLADNKL